MPPPLTLTLSPFKRSERGEGTRMLLRRFSRALHAPTHLSKIVSGGMPSSTRPSVM